MKPVGLPPNDDLLAWEAAPDPAGRRSTVVAPTDVICEGSQEPACETFAVWPARDGWMLGRRGYCGRVLWVDTGRFECIEHEASLR